MDNDNIFEDEDLFAVPQSVEQPKSDDNIFENENTSHQTNPYTSSPQQNFQYGYNAGANQQSGQNAGGNSNGQPNYNNNQNQNQYKSYQEYYNEKMAQNGRQPENKKPDDYKGLAIASLVIGIISILFFCSCINLLTALIGIVLGSVYLSKKMNDSGAKAMAVTGIVTSALSILMFCIMVAITMAITGNIIGSGEFNTNVTEIPKDKDESRESDDIFKDKGNNGFYFEYGNEFGGDYEDFFRQFMGEDYFNQFFGNPDGDSVAPDKGNPFDNKGNSKDKDNTL